MKIFFKIRRMRILGARIFSKSFGGKIRENLTAVTIATDMRIVECNKYLNDFNLYQKSFNRQSRAK